MPDQVSTFEAHRAQLSASLFAVAETMRNCAHDAETFANLVNDSSFSPENAEMLQGALDGFTKGKRKAPLSLEDDDGPKKRKRNTKPKDPSAPKRPPSSYIIFQNQVRKSLKEQNPNLSNSDLLGMISEQWRTMDKDEREIYNVLMQNAKAQYALDKATYENRSPEEIEADNATNAAAVLFKKANAKPRGPKGAAATAAAAAAAASVKARPPPTAADISPATESDDDEESDEEDVPEPKHVVDSDESGDDEEEDEDEDEGDPEPPKKRRATSAQPKDKKKTSKA